MVTLIKDIDDSVWFLPGIILVPEAILVIMVHAVRLLGLFLALIFLICRDLIAIARS